MTAKELRAKRANLWEAQKAIRDKALVAENRVMTAEEHTEFRRIEDEMKSLLEQAEAIERHEEAGKGITESRGRLATTATDSDEPATAEARDKAHKAAYRSAFEKFVRHGKDAELTDEERAAQTQSIKEARAMSLGVDTAGGLLAPGEFDRNLREAMLAFGGIRKTRATILNTSDGRDISFPTTDDTGNTGAMIGENTAVSNATDMTFALKTLRAYKFTSNLILVPTELLQDSVISIDELLTRKLAERVSRTTNSKFHLGDGATEPEGLASVSTEGVAGATGSSTSITLNNIWAMEHSIDPAYRDSTRCEWMFNDSTLLALKQMKDGEGRPLWVPGLATNAPDRIAGYRYVINQDVPAMAASVKSIYFGDFSHFYIRDVAGSVLLRLTERYAEYGQVGFILFTRHDSKLIDAGTHPIKHYTNSAS